MYQASDCHRVVILLLSDAFRVAQLDAATAGARKEKRMNYKIVLMGSRKKIALVAHDHKKQDLFDWAKFNRDLLAEHVLYATGTTGSVLEQELNLNIHKLESGPLGGDQQIGAKISANEIDFVIFFWDPLESLPHDPEK
jgi:methylglyoxal synthase